MMRCRPANHGDRCSRLSVVKNRQRGSACAVAWCEGRWGGVGVGLTGAALLETGPAGALEGLLVGPLVGGCEACLAGGAPPHAAADRQASTTIRRRAVRVTRGVYEPGLSSRMSRS
jgi:hypothetical protein